MASRASRKFSTLEVAGDWKPITGMALLCTQVLALTKKNIIVRKRAWKTNLFLVAQAAMFMMLTWTVDNAVKASNQRRPAFSSEPNAILRSVEPIPDCSTNIFMRRNTRCYTLLYAPKDVPMVEAIIAAVANNNKPPIPRDHIKGFRSGSAIDEYLLENWSTVIAAVEFAIDNEKSIGFSVQTNNSVQWFKGIFQDPNLYAQLPVQVAVEREIVRQIAGSNATKLWNVDVAEFPHPSSRSPSAVGTLLPIFLFASIMFGFVLQLYDILVEKERGIRRYMTTLGMKNFSHWGSWISWHAFLAVLQTGLLLGFGYAFQFSVFTNNNFSISFCILFGASMSMTMLAFLVGVFPDRSSAAVPLGFFIFIIGWIFIVVVGTGFPYQPEHSSAMKIIFNLMPWTLLAKGVQDLTLTSEESSIGLSWILDSSSCEQESFSPGGVVAGCATSIRETIAMFIIQIIFFFILTLYFDTVKGEVSGEKRSLLFFLWPSFWNIKNESSIRRAGAALKSSSEEDSSTDADVAAEQDFVKKRCQRFLSDIPNEDIDDVSIDLWGVKKEYVRGIFLKRQTCIAINRLWLGIREGECFCLLGPNGAGKTTLIDCLSGTTPISNGEAIINGFSVTNSSQLKQIRHRIGVCPQFDHGLWPLLSSEEHLRVFAKIKGIPRRLREGDIKSLLDSVRLTEIKDIPIAALSGGMKRRLSLAISLLGDPTIVFLDEPTTGLDPISRRYVWDVIDRMKQARAIILTTHSMEEADILGDRIGIMVRGKLRCLGNSVRLKARFGSGYRLSVRVDTTVESNIDSYVEKARNLRIILEKLLGIKTHDESHDYLHFVIEHESEDKLPHVLSYLKMHALELGILDVQLRLAPLEEVFLNVSRKAELEFAQAQGRFEFLTLDEEDIVVKVPVGAEFIKSPNGNFYYVLWVQNEDGNLELKDYWKDPINAHLTSAQTAS